MNVMRYWLRYVAQYLYDGRFLLFASYFDNRDCNSVAGAVRYATYCACMYSTVGRNNGLLYKIDIDLILVHGSSACYSSHLLNFEVLASFSWWTIRYVHACDISARSNLTERWLFCLTGCNLDKSDLRWTIWSVSFALTVVGMLILN